jgi:hypothetical protein
MAWPIDTGDVTKALNFPVSATDTDELDLYARAAVERVEEEIGPMTGQPFSSTVRGPADTIVLDAVYGSITQITVDGVVTAADTIDLVSGLITGLFNGTVIVVTGVAPATAPAVVEIATRELAAIWYTQDHGRHGGRGSTAQPFVPLGFAIPREISEKLAPFAAKKLPGIG